MRNIISKKTISTAKMMLLAIVFLILSMTVLSKQVCGLMISEIMFNPDGADTGKEWIEIELNSSDNCINLSQYKLFEDNTNHNIYAYLPGNEMVCTVAIISNDVHKFLSEYDYLNISSPEYHNPLNIAIYKSSFSLSNTGEELAIKHDNEFTDYINYSMILSQVSITEGYSLQYVDDAWRTSALFKGNPGNVLSDILANISDDYNPDENPIDNIDNTNNTVNDTVINNTDDTLENISNTIETNDSINNSTDYNNYNNTENTSNNSINDTSIQTNTTYYENVSMNQNQTNETYNNDNIDANNMTNNSDSLGNNTNNNNYTNSNNSNNTNYNISRCHVAIRILIKNASAIYENNNQIKFHNILEFDNNSLNTKNYSIEYWIEDLFGNTIKNKITTSNQDEKSFTPKIDDADEVLMMKNVLKYADCDITNTSSEAILIIKNSNYSSPITQKCPLCDCKSSKESQSKCSNPPPSIYTDYTDDVEDCSQKPILKIVNVCNKSLETSNDKPTIQNNVTQSIKKLGNNVVNNDNDDAKAGNDTINNTQSTGKTTGMIVYESPNLKNRIYAIIGVILVGVTCLGTVFYKKFNHKSETKS